MTEVESAPIETSPEKLVQGLESEQELLEKAEEAVFEGMEGPAEEEVSGGEVADQKPQRHEGSPSTDDSNSSKGEEQEQQQQVEEGEHEASLSSEVKEEASASLQQPADHEEDSSEVEPELAAALEEAPIQ